jgi:hypothetical protein
LVQEVRLFSLPSSDRQVGQLGAGVVGSAGQQQAVQVVQVRSLRGDPAQLRLNLHAMRRELADWPGLDVHVRADLPLPGNAHRLLALLDRFHDDAPLFRAQDDDARQALLHVADQVARFAQLYRPTDAWRPRPANTAGSAAPAGQAADVGAADASGLGGGSGSGSGVSPATSLSSEQSVSEVETPRGKTSEQAPLAEPWPALCEALTRWAAVPAVREHPARASAAVVALRCLSRESGSRDQLNCLRL